MCWGWGGQQRRAGVKKECGKERKMAGRRRSQKGEGREGRPVSGEVREGQGATEKRREPAKRSLKES